MDYYSILGLVAGVLSFVAYAMYCVAILRGTTKPSRSTWWVLTLIGSMILVSYWIGGARETIWVPLSYVIGPLAIALLSIKFGEGEGWSKLDKICFSLSATSIVLWAILAYFLGIEESSLIILVINLAADFIGLIPTITKSYLRPEHEDLPAWTLESIASLLNVFAIASWASFSIWSYPVYLLIVNGMVTLLLWRSKLV